MTMSLRRKRLLHVCRYELARLDVNLPADRWEIEVVDIRSRLTRLDADGERVAGLIEFSSLIVPADLRDVEHLMNANHDVAWVAAVTEAHLMDADIRKLVRSRCVSCVTLPATAEAITRAVDRAYEMSAIDLLDQHDPLERAVELIGACAAMQRLRAETLGASSHGRPVAIVGEPGAGKRLIASQIHHASTHRSGPFVAIDCGAFSPERLLVELFGEPVTSRADATQQGRIGAALGGSLYIDSICDMPFEAQSHLLSFIEQHSTTDTQDRAGAASSVRLLCSSHMELAKALEQRRLLAGLYDLLARETITVPPLRERGSDVTLLAWYVFARFRFDTIRKLRGLSTGAWSAISAYTWPGNVREMINRIRRAIVMTEGSFITAADLGLENYIDTAQSHMESGMPYWQEVALAVARSNGRMDDAAIELGVSKVLLGRMLASSYLRGSSEGR